MSVSVQESLLDVCEEPVLSALAGSVRRTPLAYGAWVDLRRGWLAGSGAVFARLAGKAGGKDACRRRPDATISHRLAVGMAEDVAGRILVISGSHGW